MDFRPLLCVIHSNSTTISGRLILPQETHIIDEESSRLTLFDTGPDSKSLIRNVESMQIPVDKIERIVTSHWHSDHTGGLLSFLDLRRSRTVESANPIVVDLHPDRPVARGIAPGPTSSYDKVLCALPFDPTFQAIEAAGGVVEKHAEGHAVAGGAVWVSGEIPRVTEFETGILGGLRWTQKSTEESPKPDGEWVSDGVNDFLVPHLWYTDFQVPIFMI
jgi:7,8-dihydropterin-6-yl-methyl-4-(beta-D-ribofuranosyl)aminobenzene 5'-phosphate synthase